MALTKTPIELSSTPSIVDGGNATAITIDSSEDVTLANNLEITSTLKVSGGTLGFGTTAKTDSHSGWNQFYIGQKGSILSENATGTHGLDGLWLTDNLYVDSDTGSFSNIETNESSAIKLEAGQLHFYSQASGSAGAAVTLSEKMTIDSSGNVGIGATPKVTEAGWTNVSVGGMGALINSTSANAGGRTQLSNNVYVDESGNYSYISTDEASLYKQIDGIHSWHNAASGSADAHITMSETMRIESSGRVNIGHSSSSANGGASVLSIGNTAGGTINLIDSDDAPTNGGLSQIYGGNQRMYFYAGGSGSSSYMQFYTNDSERMRILSGGGITFNGDTATANALDDYEEGTATLTMSAITTAPTITQGNTFTINYTKIGNLVRFVGYSGARNITNVGTGGAKFTGLPFAQAGSYYGHVTFAHSTAFATDVAVGYIESGNTFFYPITLSSTSAANYQTGTRYVMVQGIYHTA